MTREVHPIVSEMLHEETLVRDVYPDLTRSTYATLTWDPRLYIYLARAGFMSIGHRLTLDDLSRDLLIAELQTAYAVLDWDDLHVSRKLRRLRRSGRLEALGVELRVVTEVSRVVTGIMEHHAPDGWIVPSYRRVLEELSGHVDPAFTLLGVELWSTRSPSGEPMLVAGEFGYATGAVYTSMSGFCTADDPLWRSFGTLQLVLLAERLRDAGFAFWNLGHTAQPYKSALGARPVPRGEFLSRWLEAREGNRIGGLGVDEGS